MANYDSDSSLSDAGDDISTNVILGYASKEATSDSFSQLGGSPSFFDGTLPDASLARCKICNGNMSLLLQLHGDLRSRFPVHERRLYLWNCRQKQCRKKEGSIRGTRGVRVSKQAEKTARRTAVNGISGENGSKQDSKQDLGSQLFGASPSSTTPNPFSMSSASPFASGEPANPFSTASAPPSSLAAKPPQNPSSGDTASDLPATFAQKARISSTDKPSAPDVAKPKEPWPEASDFPSPYPSYYIDADSEYLSPSASDGQGPSSSHTAFMDVDQEAASSSAQSSKDDGDAEMTHDKTFQDFADRAAQNDEQILRYEFGGDPLLYSRTDPVGKLFAPNQFTSASASKVTTSGKTLSGIPRCQNCGAKRVFELQLMPHAISELEADEEAASLLKSGMEWGTIILGVCEKDCTPSLDDSHTAYLQEWVGVQWEESVKRKG